MNNYKKNKGNLSLELILVIVCLSMLFKVTYPTIKTYKNFMFVRSMDRFVYDLRRCRDLSSISGYPYIIEIERKTGNYAITTIKKGELIKISKSLDKRLYFRRNSRFLFRSNGIVDQGNTILIESYEGDFEVKVIVRPVTSYITYEVIR